MADVKDATELIIAGWNERCRILDTQFATYNRNGYSTWACQHIQTKIVVNVVCTGANTICFSDHRLKITLDANFAVVYGYVDRLESIRRRIGEWTIPRLQLPAYPEVIQHHGEAMVEWMLGFPELGSFTRLGAIEPKAPEIVLEIGVGALMPLLTTSRMTRDPVFKEVDTFVRAVDDLFRLTLDRFYPLDANPFPSEIRGLVMAYYYPMPSTATSKKRKADTELVQPPASNKPIH